MLYSFFYVVAKITLFTLLQSSRNHFFQNIFGRALTQTEGTRVSKSIYHEKLATTNTTPWQYKRQCCQLPMSKYLTVSTYVPSQPTWLSPTIKMFKQSAKFLMRLLHGMVCRKTFFPTDIHTLRNLSDVSVKFYASKIS